MITYLKSSIIIVMTLVFNASPTAFAMQDVASPVPGQTVIVALSSGDAIRATLVSETGDSIVLLHPVLGKVTLARASIASMVATTAPAAAPAAATDDGGLRQEAQPAANAVMDAPRPEDGINLADDVAAKGAVPAPAPPPSPWKFVLDANVNYVNAANDQLDFRAAAAAIYDVVDVEKWSNNIEFFYKLVDGENTDNNLLATTTYDRRFTSNPRVLWFVKGQGQSAPLESFENRLSAWGGLGYEFLKMPPVKLIGKLGAGYTYEFGNQNDGQAELYAELEWDWKITERQAIVGSYWIAPAFADPSNFLQLFRTEWTMMLEDVKGLKLLGGIRWQYQSEVTPKDAIQNDIRVYAGLRFEM